MKYVSAKSGKRGGSGGHGNMNKSSMKDQEKMLVSVTMHVRNYILFVVKVFNSLIIVCVAYIFYSVLDRYGSMLLAGICCGKIPNYTG